MRAAVPAGATVVIYKTPEEFNAVVRNKTDLEWIQQQLRSLPDLDSSSAVVRSQSPNGMKSRPSHLHGVFKFCIGIRRQTMRQLFAGAAALSLHISFIRVIAESGANGTSRDQDSRAVLATTPLRRSYSTGQSPVCLRNRVLKCSQVPTCSSQLSPVP